jgi:hypothetical protein
VREQGAREIDGGGSGPSKDSYGIGVNNGRMEYI